MAIDDARAAPEDANNDNADADSQGLLRRGSRYTTAEGFSALLTRLSGPLGRLRFLSEKGNWGRSVLPAQASHWALQLAQLAEARGAVLDVDEDFADELE